MILVEKIWRIWRSFSYITSKKITDKQEETYHLPNIFKNLNEWWKNIFIINANDG